MAKVLTASRASVVMMALVMVKKSFEVSQAKSPAVCFPENLCEPSAAAVVHVGFVLLSQLQVRELLKRYGVIRWPCGMKSHGQNPRDASSFWMRSNLSATAS